MNNTSFEVRADWEIIGGFKLGDLPYPVRTDYKETLFGEGRFDTYFAEWVLKYNTDTWSDHIKDTVLRALAHATAGKFVTVAID